MMKKTKLALKKESSTEKGTLPLKNATSKEIRGNLSEGPSSRSETNKETKEKFCKTRCSSETNKNNIPSKEMCRNEETNRDESNESKNPVKEESSHRTSISNEANKSQNPVKEESSHQTSTSDESNKSENPVKREASTCDGANKNRIPNKKESSQKNTFDKEEMETDSLFTLTDNVLIGKQEHFQHFEHIGFAILDALKKSPEFIGQVDVTTGEQITFQQMRENSVKCALLLKEIFASRKCAPIVTICTRNPMLEYIPYLAALYLGATVNPWEEEYFAVGVRVYYFLVRHRPGVIFIDDHNATKLQQIVKFLQHHENKINPQIIVFGQKKGFISLQDILAIKADEKDFDELSCNKLELTSPAILMFSSNATHYPGDVIIPYQAFVCPIMQVPKMNYGEIGLWYGSLCWTHSLFLTARAISSFTTVLKCPKRLFKEEHLFQTVQKYKVTWIFLESSMCNKMCRTNFMVNIYDISSLKTFLFGDTLIEEEIHKDFVEYMTDVSIMQVYCDALTGVIAYQRKSSNRRSSGHINNYVKVKIIDINTKQKMGPNERGEIWCGSPYVDYSRTFCTYENIYPVNNQRKDWHCTGDYGYFDENGEIYIIDKVRHLIRYKDTIVSAAEIEKVLLRHVTVAEVAVVPTQNANDGQHPVAFVRTLFRLKVTEKELVNHVARHMDDNCKLRGGVYFVKEFKYLPNGKIDRQRLTYDVKYSKNERNYARIGNSVVEL